MPEKDQDERPEVPPPPPRQPDESLKGYIERDNKPDGTADRKGARLGPVVVGAGRPTRSGALVVAGRTAEHVMTRSGRASP